MKMTMKLAFATLVGLSIAALTVQAKNEAEKKPVKTVAEAGVWHTDFEKAKAIAKAEKRPMLIDFTGSDWCGWCVKLDKEVFSKDEFKEYAAENLVLVELDFPRKKAQSAAEKAQNAALAKKFEIRGYPTILLIDADGKEIARTGYQKGGPKSYVRHLEKLLK